MSRRLIGTAMMLLAAGCADQQLMAIDLSFDPDRCFGCELDRIFIEGPVRIGVAVVSSEDSDVVASRCVLFPARAERTVGNLPELLNEPEMQISGLDEGQRVVVEIVVYAEDESDDCPRSSEDEPLPIVHGASETLTLTGEPSPTVSLTCSVDPSCDDDL